MQLARGADIEAQWGERIALRHNQCYLEHECAEQPPW
jgi:hypothetical protein